MVERGAQQACLKVMFLCFTSSCGLISGKIWALGVNGFIWWLPHCVLSFCLGHLSFGSLLREHLEQESDFVLIVRVFLQVPEPTDGSLKKVHNSMELQYPAIILPGWSHHFSRRSLVEFLFLLFLLRFLRILSRFYCVLSHNGSHWIMWPKHGASTHRQSTVFSLLHLLY